MKKISLTLLSLLLITPTALAAPMYERPIDLHGLTSLQPVFMAIPDDVLARSPLESLRIRKGDTIVPSKSSPAFSGTFRGVVASATICSAEGKTGAEALYDGAPSTSVRPDPLKNPTSCTVTLRFFSPARVDGVSIAANQNLKNLVVSARNGNGFTTLAEAKNTSSIQMSSVVTDGLQLSFTYDKVPTLSEVAVSGTQTARLLFAADPQTSYTLVYGDDQPPVLPTAPASLASTINTPYVFAGNESATQVDNDEDSITDAQDNCPHIANKDQKDTDHDNIGNACDNAPTVPNILQNDQDNDGVGDANDNCQNLFNPDQRDDDLNGVGNVCDDADKDGVMNSRDNCTGIVNRDQKDSNGDGIGDACQLDRDSDSVPDTVDNCRNTSNKDQLDTDKDNIGDSCDSCPTTKNQGQEDVNSNGIGDACEGSLVDIDGDGIVTSNDNCASIANADQSDMDKDGLGDSCDNCPSIQNRDQIDTDKNHQGDACTDLDSDGLLAPLDNCPTVANSDQLDKNNNGIGDACEDDDGDGVLNAKDNCRYKYNADQKDTDADSIGDVCDTENNQFSEEHPWVVWIGMSFIVLVLLSLTVRMIVKIQKEGGMKK